MAASKSLSFASTSLQRGLGERGREVAARVAAGGQWTVGSGSWVGVAGQRRRAQGSCSIGRSVSSVLECVIGGERTSAML